MPREDDLAELAGESELTGSHEQLRRFTAEELIACEQCLRANAPTRMGCLYCGSPLPVTERTAELRRPTLKKLEEWERGINVILLPRGAGEMQSDAIEEAASFLRLDAARLSEIVEARRALPVARASSVEEAELITKRLGALGFVVEALSDELLAKQPSRARALAFDDDALVCFSSFDAAPHRLPWTEISLLVVGRVVTKRVEVAERRARLSSQSNITDSRELASDESVLDIYAGEADGEGFRVLAYNFDYSCLGEGKSLLARDNFGALVEALRERAPSAILDDEYARLRGLLSTAWPPTERTESLGLRRERPGRFATEAATTFNNETQFTRYARLRLHITSRGRAGGEGARVQ
ncbi:MAG TPA: hypothetical protein VEX60_11025 [Pyrinomonadaceae bacterium]|nr:hypothetical protein [Pyrinomonadaceae bacterium]